MTGNLPFRLLRRQEGFSLAELLAALVIAAMVLIAVLGIYSRTETGAGAITRRLESSQLPLEILQRIAEDIDRATAAGSDTKVTIENKFESGFPTARLTILKTIYGKDDKKRTFENIVWQAGFDYDNNTDGLTLYRSHSGIDVEDKILDKQKDDWERELFVPICTGVTFFKVQVPRGDTFQDRWAGDSPPGGIVITISFAQPFKTLDGTLDVPEAEKITRVIAINRIRKIKFIIIEKEQQEEEQSENEQEQSSE